MIFSRLNSHFASERGHGNLNEVFRVVGVHVELLADFFQPLNGDFQPGLVAVDDSDWVDPFVDELLGLLQKRTGKYCEREHIAC